MANAKTDGESHHTDRALRQSDPLKGAAETALGMRGEEKDDARVEEERLRQKEEEQAK